MTMSQPKSVIPERKSLRFADSNKNDDQMFHNETCTMQYGYPHARQLWTNDSIMYLHVATG